VLRRDRTIQIFALSLDALEGDRVLFRVHCSAGTYVRTLAELIAERLGTAGHVSELTRQRIGHWVLQDATPLVWFERAAPESIIAQLRPIPVVYASVSNA
jgi:tRNA pseudouridine55 synthase